MFNIKPSSMKTELQVVRTKAISELETLTSDSDDYKRIMNHVETLSNLIDAEKLERLSPNTVAVILGNVGIAALVLWHERDNVLTTKLLPFLSKTKS